MSYETPEAKRAELIRLRLEELKHFLEDVGRRTNNRMMKDFRNQLAHCSITYGLLGTVFMKETSVMRQIIIKRLADFEEERCVDGQGYEKVYVNVEGKRKILFHVYSLEQWEQLYNQFRVELAQAGELIPLPRTVAGCPQCGDFPESHFGGSQIICPHVRDGIEMAYVRDEFGHITANLKFTRSLNSRG